MLLLRHNNSRTAAQKVTGLSQFRRKYGDHLKKFFHRLVSVLSPVLCGLFLSCAVIGSLTPDTLTTSVLTREFFHSTFPLSLHYNSTHTITASTDTADKSDSLTAELMLFDFFPVKEVSVTLSEHRQVYVSGETFGMRLYADGLVVSSVCRVPVPSGTADPAGDAGIQQGDILLSVNGVPLRTNEQLAEAAVRSGTQPLILRVRRGDQYFTASVTPVYDTDTHTPKLGLHIRDSIAGIGTMTFIDPRTKHFAGLGHGICDTASGCLIPLLNGDIVPISITSVTKSICGNAGTLCGHFDDSQPQGTLSLNSEHGVYGTVNTLPTNKPLVPVAFRQEVVTGPAQLISTVDNGSPQTYDIVIEDISYNDRITAKNMVIRITDERLLSKTGGIVQGMSGSPILQNGQLAGALTHVFINDPAHGYAIFAEHLTDNA